MEDEHFSHMEKDAVWRPFSQLDLLGIIFPWRPVLRYHSAMQNDIMTRHYMKSRHVVERTIAGERLLIPLGNGKPRLEGLYNLNETAAYIWDLAVSGNTGRDISEQMAKIYSVTPEEAEKDVRHTMNGLLAAGALCQKES